MMAEYINVVFASSHDHIEITTKLQNNYLREINSSLGEQMYYNKAIQNKPQDW